MKITNAAAVINRFERLFSIWIMDNGQNYQIIKMDNGLPFNSSEFRDYPKSVNIRDEPIISEHLKSNAAVES